MADHGEYREEFPDEHPHSYDHTEPRGSLLLILIVLTAILLTLTGIGIQYYYETLREHEVQQRVLVPENNQLRDLRNKEDYELHTYGYTDQPAGKVRIPIDRAMQMVAQEARENRVKWPTASYPVKTAAELAASPAVSQPGAATANNANKQGTGSSPIIQGDQKAGPQQHK
jgi:hypothetical protein